MEFKKLNKLQKWLLKYKDKEAYTHYKYLLSLEESGIRQVQLVDKPVIACKHSGNIGDIIYALPTAYALAGDGKINMLLAINEPMQHKHKYHPSGNVMLTKTAAEMLKPLLLYQDKIADCAIYNGEQLDYDLDVFRKQPIHFDKGNISRWYSYIFPVFPDSSQPWLKAPVDPFYNEYIVVERSHRYRSPNIDYAFLSKYSKILFVGVDNEYADMKANVPAIEYKKVKDFQELATIINSCRFFIGNQSFPFSIAEALKTPRLLEVYYQCPNVVVEGKNGYDFYYQQQFETIVEQLYNSYDAR
jgi:hypothetical protein